jgi:hypothetical protein
MYIGFIALIVFLVIGYLLTSHLSNAQNRVQAVTVVPGTRYGASENFQERADLPIGGGDSPALDKPRTPYTLMGDVLRPLEMGKAHELITAQKCYDRDFKAQDSLVGNYVQRTNNVMTTYPDTCTGPRQELILGFYEKPGIVYI